MILFCHEFVALGLFDVGWIDGAGSMVAMFTSSNVIAIFNTFKSLSAMFTGVDRRTYDELGGIKLNDIKVSHMK